MMFPIQYEKTILRRVVPTWEELICNSVAKGSLTRAELSISKCIRRVPKSIGRRLGADNALLILSPGCDCNRLLFYLLVYIINPLHVYDDGTSEYKVVFQNEMTQAHPPLGVQNLEMALRSHRAYHSIFDLSPLESPEDGEMDRALYPHMFHNLKLRSALQMRSRLVLVLGLDLDESVVIATQFAYLIKNICRPTESNADSMCIQIPFPVFLDGTVLANEREKMYIQGGIYFVPSRILLVDLLTSKLVPELISGIVVVNAHRMTKDYNIPFFIKLLRSRNRVAFIKAITDNVNSMRNRENLIFVLKSLFTKECFIFPRCSSAFDNVLNNERVQPDTFEVGFELSEKAKQIHNTIVQLLHRLLTELQRHSNNELQELDMNTIMYTTNVKRLLEGVLQRVSTSTSGFYLRRIMRNITNLHMFLMQLLGMNALNFLAFAEQIKSAEADSDWLWTPLGTSIYRLAMERVYEPKAEEDSGLIVKMEKDSKSEYIRILLCNAYVDPEELGHMIITAMKWHRCRRPFKGPSRYKTTHPRSNLSYHVTRRMLCRRETRHIRRICRFFECGGILFRRALLLVDSSFLQSHLSSSLPIPVEKYNEAAFFAYASRRADSYEYGPKEEEKFTAYAQTHFYRSLIKSRRETDKLLHRFAVWTKYNEIYRINQHNSAEVSETPLKKTGIDSIAKEMDTYMGREMNAGKEDDQFFEESVRTQRSDYSVSSSDDEAQSAGPAKVTNQAAAAKRKTQDTCFSMSLPINDKLKCKLKVVNVSFTQPRSEVLKGIMERKLSADDSAEPIPLVSSPYEFGYMLHRIQPTVIIIYRPNIRMFRIIEQYCAQRFLSSQRKYLRVYVLSYRNCLESHKFAREIKNELESWQQIQQHIKTLPLTFDEGVLVDVGKDGIQHESKDDIQNLKAGSENLSPSMAEEKLKAAGSPSEPPQESNGNTSLRELSNTHQEQLAMPDATLTSLKPLSRVLVDTREFRCQLPYHLYSRDIQLVPLVLEMGDYLITRDMCVERKSLYDLVSSLSSGRLAQQAEELCSVYDYPFLLVEFDGPDTFYLSPCADDNAFGFNYVYSKLCILCCNYPKLRIIWSQSPKVSARIISMLKAGRSEPDITTNNMVIAQARGFIKIDDDNKEAIALRRSTEDVNNRDALRILRKIPGVTSYNIGEILSRVKSLRELSAMTEESLRSFLPEANASSIFKFFNQSLRGVLDGMQDI